MGPIIYFFCKDRPVVSRPVNLTNENARNCKIFQHLSGESGILVTKDRSHFHHKVTRLRLSAVWQRENLTSVPERGDVESAIRLVRNNTVTARLCRRSLIQGLLRKLSKLSATPRSFRVVFIPRSEWMIERRCPMTVTSSPVFAGKLPHRFQTRLSAEAMNNCHNTIPGAATRGRYPHTSTHFFTNIWF